MTNDVTTDWECTDCGYVFVGRKPPRRCPDCGAEESFVEVEYDDWDDDHDDR